MNADTAGGRKTRCCARTTGALPPPSPPHTHTQRLPLSRPGLPRAPLLPPSCPTLPPSRVSPCRAPADLQQRHAVPDRGGPLAAAHRAHAAAAAARHRRAPLGCVSAARPCIHASHQGTTRCAVHASEKRGMPAVHARFALPAGPSEPPPPCPSPIGLRPRTALTSPTPPHRTPGWVVPPPSDPPPRMRRPAANPQGADRDPLPGRWRHTHHTGCGGSR